MLPVSICYESHENGSHMRMWNIWEWKTLKSNSNREFFYCLGKKLLSIIVRTNWHYIHEWMKTLYDSFHAYDNVMTELSYNLMITNATNMSTHLIKYLLKFIISSTYNMTLLTCNKETQIYISHYNCERFCLFWTFFSIKNISQYDWLKRKLPRKYV